MKCHGFSGLKRLEFLKLAHFSFNSSANFNDLPNLLSLELISCSNSAPDLLTNSLPLLEQLTLENRMSSDFSVEIPPNLKHLYLKCRIVCDDIGHGLLANLPRLVSLRIDCDDRIAYTHNNENKAVINANLFGGVPALRTLEMAHTRIPWSSWRHLTKLTTLVCKYWRGQADFTAFGDLRELRTLHLSNCGLRNVPANAFATLENLETLFLNGNKLAELNGEAFIGLARLKWLNLKWNDLEKFRRVNLNDVLGELRCLEKLDLSSSNVAELDSISVLLAELSIDADLISYDDYSHDSYGHYVLDDDKKKKKKERDDIISF
jgi:Leucine-rich repeat (LRR) protein